MERLQLHLRTTSDELRKSSVSRFCGQQFWDRVRLHAADREVYGEDCAFSFPEAFGLDSSAVELYEVLNDGEADSETPVSPCGCTVALNERFEDMRQKF